ncbi:MAG: ATP synthase F1 subunit delta [bacterium]
MKEGILAQRYAKALFTVALERKLLDKVRSELHDFVARLAGEKQLSEFMHSPEYSRAAKRKILEKGFQDRYSNIFFNFIALVAEKGRSTLYREIYLAFNELYDRHHRKARALAITPAPMDKADLDALQSDLSKAMKLTFEIENRVDPNILGGLVLNIGGKILDASVRRQLDSLLQVMANRLN